MSTTNVRKLACIFSNIIHGLFILTLSFSGNNETLVIFNLVSAVVVSGAISSGAIPGIVDLAPNYAGVLQGINGTFVNSCISISPYIVGLITYQQVLIYLFTDNHIFYLPILNYESQKKMNKKQTKSTYLYV